MKNIKDIKNIFYINLDSRPDRKSHFESEMQKLHLNATRFNAIKHFCGAIGCSMSHLGLLKFAKKHELDHILIMEDDITFLSPDIFINSINNFLSSNIDFDVLLISGNNMGEYNKINDFCVKITKCQTTTGYLVKNHYYDKLIDNIENGVNKLLKNLNRLNDYAIDQYWGYLQKIDNWYLLTPLTITQRPDYSDIEKRHTNYNRVMLDLDKKALRHVGVIKERVILSNTMIDVINNNI
jgi:GR25 family glycosyltransferase involved in LPS biosynthesis